VKKISLAIAFLGLTACLVMIGAAGTREDTDRLIVEMLARNERVIPLAWDQGEFHCLHLKPPELLIRNQGRDVALVQVGSDQISSLMPEQNESLNGYLADPDDPEAAYRLRRIYGEPVITRPEYYEGHQLPASSYARLGLDALMYFLYQGTAVIEEFEVIIKARDERGRTVTGSVVLPFEAYECRNDYHFPLAGTATAGSLPIGPGHRFGNSQEFAIDILDLRRFPDGTFSTSRVRSPMVIMGSENAADYYIYNRPVRAMAPGTVIGIENRYPDEIAANPRVPFPQRNERLREILGQQGVSPTDMPGANYVFIDHGNGEYARYVHLREEIPVRVGDRVSQGDIIGYVGNSGQSTEPHLHLELLDSPDYLSANCLPITFSNLNLAGALDSPYFGGRNSFIFSEFIFVISN